MMKKKKWQVKFAFKYVTNTNRITRNVVTNRVESFNYKLYKYEHGQLVKMHQNKDAKNRTSSLLERA